MIDYFDVCYSPQALEDNYIVFYLVDSDSFIVTIVRIFYQKKRYQHNDKYIMQKRDWNDICTYIDSVSSYFR